ncbi:unnamed protein product [Brassica oleracea]|uniref:(rape) hypothetical protein n=1 Tax=Brassica napus TaxID=3708 RepID=A0A816JHX9_BRANA|nr:unnamed protein product [Brassica napus]
MARFHFSWGDADYHHETLDNLKIADPSPHISLTLSRSIEGSINRDIDFRSGEDHPNDDMTGAVNPSMDSNPIVNNIGPDNTNQCDTTATIEGCS